MDDKEFIYVLKLRNDLLDYSNWTEIENKIVEATDIVIKTRRSLLAMIFLK